MQIVLWLCYEFTIFIISNSNQVVEGVWHDIVVGVVVDDEAPLVLNDHTFSPLSWIIPIDWVVILDTVVVAFKTGAVVDWNKPIIVRFPVAVFTAASKENPIFM